MARAIKVLVVEDEAVVAMSVKMTLMGHGYDVMPIAISADSALVLTAQFHPDVVLMDIKIKGDKDGIETAKLISSHYKIPIIYTTAFHDEDTVKRANATAPAGYLIKPYSNNELFMSIEKAYEGRGNGSGQG